MDEQETFRWDEWNPLCLLLRLLRELPAILAAGLAAVMLVMAFLQTFHHPVYTTSATLAVNLKSSGYSSVISDLSSTTEIADTFTQLFSSNLFSSVAKSQMGLDSLPGTLAASAIPETNLLTLRVTANSPEDAFRTLRLMIENYDKVSEYAFQNVILKELDSPNIPTAPSNPVNWRHSVKLAFLAGAAGMTALILVLILLSDTVQTSAAAHRKLDLRHFGTLHYESKNKTMRTRLKQVNKGLLITMPVVSFHFTEDVYKLATKLNYAQKDSNQKVLLVSSVLENEGKSTVAANLALSLALEGKKVLLLDADFHKPALCRLLKQNTQVELADVLAGTAKYAPELMERENLYTLLSTEPRADGAELIDNNMRQLLARARADMDFIIIDSPPIAMFSDVEVLADLADFSLLVVRQDRAGARQINDAADRLSGCRAKLLGYVFNSVRGIPFSNDHHSYGYGYGYGYGYKYGYGYGYGHTHKHSGRKTMSQTEEDHDRT